MLRVGVDGRYGDDSKSAAQRMQQSYGLVADGVVRLPFWLLLEHLHSQMPMTIHQLQSLVKDATLAVKYHEAMLETWKKYDISTPLRQAHFLSQTLHETGGLRWIWEIWGPTEWQVRYEPPHRKARELGNTEKGDGFRFRGWGLTHLTGRYNVERFCEHLGITPDELERRRDDVLLQGFSAGWYWEDRGINVVADRDDAKAVTRKINTGLLHLDHRMSRLTDAKQVLGLLVTG